MKRIYGLLSDGVIVMGIAILLLLLNSEVTRGQLADSPWPMFHYNLLHTARSPYDTSRVDGEVKWSFEPGAWSESSPVIGSDGTIYIGVHGEFGKLYAIDPANPTMPKWIFDTGRGLFTWGMWKAIQATPAISADGTIYVVALAPEGDLGKLYAINPDGSPKWPQPFLIDINEDVWSSPAIGPDGTIYVGSHDAYRGKLYAINPDRSLKWQPFETQSDVSSSPAIAPDGTIYIGSGDGNLYAIDSTNGNEKWRFTIPIPPSQFIPPGTKKTYTMVESSPAIGSDGTIYVGSAVKMFDQEDNPLSTIGKLYAIDPNTRTEIWSFPSDNYIDAEVWSSPAIALDGTIYFGTGWGSDSNVYAINPDGTQKWSLSTGGSVESSPIIGSDGTIYVGSSDRNLYAINPNGTVKWTYNTPCCGWVASPAIGADGTIYALNDKLYAFGVPPSDTCTYTVSPTNQSFSSNGGIDSISVTTQSGCSWTVTETLDWVSILSGSSGTGNGTVTYSVSVNNTEQSREGTITIGNQTFTIRQAKSVFNDVTDATHWAYRYIYAIYTEGITVGCGNNNYCPNDQVTRGQMAAFIIRAKYGEDFSYTQTPYFSDVPATHVFFKYVQKLKDEGITAVSGVYGVDNEVTRAQMAAFIIRAKFGETFNYTTTPYFSDVPSTHTFFKYVQKLKDGGITAVTGTYGVDNIVTRAQMAAFLSRAFLGME